MSQDVIHVYFMPGLAANPAIFEYIKLPKNQFEVHFLEWFMPEDNETLESYAKRMMAYIKHKNIVLVGVSFGGILVQEISKYIVLKKLIIISSVKHKNELPTRMKLAAATKAYKLLPTQLVEHIELLTTIDLLAKYNFTSAINKRVKLYKKYLSVSDKKYLDWGIEKVLCWQNETVIPGIIHIHGDKDAVFPHTNINDCILVKGGTHAMVIYKYKWFNEHLPKLILY